MACGAGWLLGSHFLTCSCVLVQNPARLGFAPAQTARAARRPLSAATAIAVAVAGTPEGSPADRGKTRGESAARTRTLLTRTRGPSRRTITTPQCPAWAPAVATASRLLRFSAGSPRPPLGTLRTTSAPLLLSLRCLGRRRRCRTGRRRRRGLAEEAAAPAMVPGLVARSAARGGEAA